MNIAKTLGGAVVAATLVGAVAPASATSWFDYSQRTTSITITSSNFNSPTELRRVTVRCPANGYLVANAESSFNFSMPAYPSKGWVRFGISTTSDFQSGHYRSLQAYQTAANHSEPGGMMRIDRCSKNQVITYRFLGQKVGPSSASAWAPRLVVEYFNRRI